MNQVAAIQAIPTAYNGYKFRSRLEARWAIVMDCLSIKYQYEPEGYQQGSLRYLPDFYLPEIRAFLEVKPTVELALSDSSREKCSMLSKLKPVLLFAGECGPPKYSETDWHTVKNAAFIFTRGVLEYHTDGESYHPSQVFTFVCCPVCSKSGLSRKGSLYHLDGDCDYHYILNGCRSFQMQAAFALARRARFDHPKALRITPREMHSRWIHVWTEAYNNACTTELPVGAIANDDFEDVESDEYEPEELALASRLRDA